MSVVITCYNYAEFLPAAVMSALSQEGVEVELIIVDDASSDDSLKVAHGLAAQDPRVSVITNPLNLGAPAAFNVGLAAARGEYLVRLDADDLLTPGSLARGVAVMQSLPEVGLVYGRPLHFSGTRLPKPRTAPTSWTVWQGSEWLAARCLDGTNVITSPEAIVRRSLLADHGGMTHLAHTHDMELWLRLSAYSDVAYVQGSDQAWHREHSASLSRQADPPLIILNELRAAFTELFAGLGDTYSGRRELMQSSARGVALQAVAQMRRLLDRGVDSTTTLDSFRAFALETDPNITSTSAWRRMDRQASRRRLRATARVMGLMGRLTRRIDAELRVRRWQRSGCYETLLLLPMGDQVLRARAVLVARPGAASLQ